MRMRTLLCAGSVLAFLSATPALAQTEPPAEQQPPAPDAVSAAENAAQQDSASAEPDVIVVTAQLREQRPIEVPYALTAYAASSSTGTASTISRIWRRSRRDSRSRTSHRTIRRSAFAESPTISLDAFFEPRVSIYQDGVSISKPAGAYVELFDIERVEISKGPAVHVVRTRRTHRRGEHRAGQAAA